jgi:predicted site-specific integrase-resolvase
MSRISAEKYAADNGVNVQTVRRWCREGRLVARKVTNKDWRINVELTERALSLAGGNSLEKSLTRSAK